MGATPLARLMLVLLASFAIHINLATALRFLARDTGNQNIVQVPLRNFHNQMYTTHVQMAEPPVWFNFSLALTQAYTAVAGVGCPNCSNDPTQHPYNPANSSTYVAQASNVQNTTLKIDGRTIKGELAKEDCGFRQQDKQWWLYKNQTILVASTGSDSSAFGNGGGIAGLGQTNAVNAHDSIINQILATNTSISQFIFGLALYDQTATKASNGVQLTGDASGGFMHLNGPDPSFYTGAISTLPVAGSDVSASWGSVPQQLGSFDWTVQTQGWLVKTASGDVTGSQGMYGTMESNYPYVLIPQVDANKLYAAIPGSIPYVLPSGAVDSNGATVFQDNLALSWSIPCSTTNLNFYVNFNGISIPMASSDFMTKIGSVCVGNVKAWADVTKQTGILGTAFLRNAYIVFTANTDTSANTVGLANRPLIDGRSKDSGTKGIIIGAVVGGLVFLLCVTVAIFFIARRLKAQRRRHSLAPSAIFAPAISGQSLDDHYYDNGEKRKSVRNSTMTTFLSGLGSPTSASGSKGNFVAEPWVPPKDGPEQGVVVTPWAPAAPAEQAFLSPTGNAGDMTVVSPAPSSSQHSNQYPSPNPRRPMSMQSASYSPMLTSESPRARAGSVGGMSFNGGSSTPGSPTPLLGGSGQQYQGGSSQYHGSSQGYHGGGQQYPGSPSPPYSAGTGWTPTSSMQYHGQLTPGPQSQVQSLPPGAMQRSLPPPPPQQ